VVDLLATIGVGIAIKGEGLRLSNGFLADAVLLRREENLADMKGSSSQGDRQFIVFHKTIALPAGSLRRFGTSDEKYTIGTQEPDPQKVYKAMRKATAQKARTHVTSRIIRPRCSLSAG
jgi:hypothetical protein